MKKHRKLRSLKKINNLHLCNTNIDAMIRMKNNTKHKLKPEEMDLMVVDLTFKELYNEGDRVVVDFKKDILEKYNIEYNESMIERYWDILHATNLVKPVVGFGNTYKLSMGTDGYNLMHRFGSYKSYVQMMMQANGQASMTASAKNNNVSVTPLSTEGDKGNNETYYEE